MPDKSFCGEHPDPQSVLAALNDSACREMIATLSEPMTAKELSDRTDIPLSTVYRKLDRLESAAMIEQRTEVARNGSHRSQYVAAFDGLYVDLDDEHRLTIKIEPTTSPSDDWLVQM